MRIDGSLLQMQLQLDAAAVCLASWLTNGKRLLELYKIRKSATLSSDFVACAVRCA